MLLVLLRLQLHLLPIQSQWFDSQHTTTLAPKQSPNVPTAVNAQAQEDSELQIVRVDDNNDRFRYYPGDVEWQQRKCRELRL